jgi:Outer membrane protein beta-barrel domain
MKARIVIVAIAALLIPPVCAHAGYGILVGGGKTYVKASSSYPVDDANGYAAGVFLQGAMSPGLAARGYVGYRQLGFKETYVDPAGNADATLKTTTRADYFSVSVLIVASGQQGSSSRGYLLFGPRVDLLAHDGGATFHPAADEASLPGNLPHDYRSSIIGGTVGAGASMGAGPAHLLFEIHYDFNFSDVSDVGWADLGAKGLTGYVGVALGN